MCFLRHLSEEECFKILDKALAHKDKIYGVGLDFSYSPIFENDMFWLTFEKTNL